MLTAILAALLPALVPAGVDLVKNIGSTATRKILGLSVDDQLKMENSVVERLKALAGLENPYGTPSQWVVDLRAAFRYVAAGFLLVIGAGVTGYGSYKADQNIMEMGGALMAGPWSFVFGERMWMGMKAK